MDQMPDDDNNKTKQNERINRYCLQTTSLIINLILTGFIAKSSKLNGTKWKQKDGKSKRLFYNKK